MKRFVLLVAVAVVLVSVLGVYYLYDSSNASNIEGPISGYLTEPSSYETMIFLVSTDNPRYGFYKWSYTGYGYGAEINEGDPCFIVNVTVRNDYTTDPVWTDDASLGLYNNHVKLTAILYNHQGRVDAVDVTYPINSFHGGHVFRVEPEETHSVELYLATDCKDIERYEIYVTYIGPAMEP